MRATIFCLLLFAFFPAHAVAHVRNIFVKGDEILIVRSALGIATIIQVPETIQSVIIGDGSGFKIENIDRAVTVKPLRWGAKTNLYLVTEKQRYNLRLVTLSQEHADYVVYIKASLANPSVRWTESSRFSDDGQTRLTVERVGTAAREFILVDARLSTKSSETTALKPDSIWITQRGTSRVINSLFLSRLVLSKSNSVLVGISLAKSDLLTNQPLTIEIRGRPKLTVLLPEAALWK